MDSEFALNYFFILCPSHYINCQLYLYDRTNNNEENKYVLKNK